MPPSLVPFRGLHRVVLTASACLVLATPAHAGTWGGIMSGARLLVEDLAYMVSSPVRLDRTGWLQTAGVLGAGAVIFAYDQEIFDAFQEAKGNKAYEALLYLGHQWEPIGNMGNTNAYYVGAATVGWLAVGPIPAAEPLAVIPTQILESHITTGGIRNVAEVLIGRLRPFEGQGPYAFDPGEGTSFPSGHASVAFELAGILSHHGFRTPFGKPIWVFTHFAATSLALERIDTETHWPSDVYIASVLGAITSRTIVRRWEERAASKTAPTGARYTITPSLARGGAGFRVDVRF